MDTQDKRKDIVKAASSCFARYGYEKTTLDDIGKLVGLNKASLYYYYKNKESIYTEVIFSETDIFLTNVFAEVDKVQGCKNKILTYLTERLKYIKNALNLKQLSMDSVQKIAPLFNEMYSKIIEKEIVLLSGVLECCIQNEEMTSCETGRIAKSIILVAEVIRSKIDCHLSSDETYTEALEEIKFTVSLILDGLMKK
jgi:AcrR family transcriptional regulator